MLLIFLHTNPASSNDGCPHMPKARQCKTLAHSSRPSRPGAVRKASKARGRNLVKVPKPGAARLPFSVSVAAPSISTVPGSTFPINTCTVPSRMSLRHCLPSWPLSSRRCVDRCRRWAAPTVAPRRRVGLHGIGRWCLRWRRNRKVP